MAYEPHTWTDDELITKERLNAMEQGIKNEQVGPQGPKGDKGETGPQGPKGDQGETGAQGPAGTVEAATKEKAGAVKQMALISDASTDTGADLKTKINEILTGMKTAGIMSES